MKILERYRLHDDTYLFVLETCLAIAKVDKAGNIVRLTTFGNKPKEVQQEKGGSK